MNCILCQQSLQQINTYSANIYIYQCRDCQMPKYNTFYKEVYHKLDINNIHATSLRVDDYIINTYYTPAQGNKAPRTIFFKKPIGTLDSSGDIEPLTHGSYVLKFDDIIELPTHNLELLKSKIAIWTTFC